MAAPPDGQRKSRARQKISRILEKMPENELLRLLNSLEAKGVGRNRRIVLRKPFLIPARCTSANRSTDGYIVNMSESGVFMETTRPIPMGRDISLSFSVLNFEIPVRLEGKVVWSDARGMGIKFKRGPSLACRLDAQKIADAVKSKPFPE